MIRELSSASEREAAGRGEAPLRARGLENVRTSGKGCVGLLIIAVLASLPPLTLILDFLRPAVFEGGLRDALADARGFREPLFDLTDYVCIGMLTILVVGVATVALTRRAVFLQKVLLATWSISIPLLATELVLQSFDRPSVFRPDIQLVYHPDPEIMPGITGSSRFSTNSLGMRGPQWEDDAYKILCIGGSTTICSYLDDDETWPRQLMHILNTRQSGKRYWVGNVGKSGRDALHHVELIKRLPEASRVDCCMVLCGINDFEHSIRLPYRIRERLTPSGVFDVGGAWRPIEPYFKQTYLYGWTQLLLGWTPVRSAMEVEDIEGRAYSLRRKSRQAATKDYPLPPLEADLDRFRDSLAMILTLNRAQGVRTVFLTQPTLWHEGMAPDLEALLWSKPIGRTGRAVHSGDLARGMEAYNEVILDICRAEVVQCVDLAALCPKDTTVFYDDAHFNESGARIVAGIIAEQFQP